MLLLIEFKLLSYNSQYVQVFFTMSRTSVKIFCGIVLKTEFCTFSSQA